MFGNLIDSVKRTISNDIETCKHVSAEKAKRNQEIYKKNLMMQEKLKSFKNVTLGANTLYVNQELKQWYFSNNKQKIFNFSDVINCELIENENTVTTTTSTSKGKKHISLGKAIVGGLIVGQAGAIIGGTAGKTKTTGTSTSINNEYCTNLSILVTLNSLDTPMIELNLLKGNINKNSQIYRKSIEDAKRIQSTFQVIINRNQQ